ncbi:hypothetical protein X975_04632, partial [Stegodyphus mimosarum]
MFRKKWWLNYHLTLNYNELDPVYFVPAADLTWNAAQKVNKINLQLLKNFHDYIWLENRITGMGDACSLSTCYKQINNVFDNYNPEAPTHYISALGASNLCGYIMSQSLPVESFSWLFKSEIENFSILNCAQESSIGCILEMDFFIHHICTPFINDLSI